MFVTRGSHFSTVDGKNESYDVLRIFVWARDKIVGRKDSVAFLIAVCELSGQILCYDEKKFNELEEREVAEAQRKACHDMFQEVRDKVKSLMMS